MELEFSFRNNTRGPLFPTFQERVNAMLPTQRAQEAASSAAPELQGSTPATPHILNEEEVQGALSLMETEARQQHQDIIQVHSGLDAQRVARLLGLV
ncbi:MAG: pseudouridine synthase [Desulfovibrio sp.]|jgi:hypothetical protein|nr:pseudouridine synthase [Desulfovibrio sp.]